ncbi:MAG: hypothetical protein WBO70_04865 [Erysipelotrichaceae bacterium]
MFIIKKKIIIILSILLAIGTFVTLYLYNMPQKIEVVSNEITDYNRLTYQNIEDYVKQQSENVFLYFCSYENNNCIYINNIIIPNIIRDYNLKGLKDIQFVDLSNIDTSFYRFRRKWTIKEFPAFINAKYNLESETIEVKSILQWDDKVQITQDNLVKWLKDNGIIK